jgi:hypothetical protein
MLDTRQRRRRQIRHRLRQQQLNKKQHKLMGFERNPNMQSNLELNLHRQTTKIREILLMRY